MTQHVTGCYCSGACKNPPYRCPVMQSLMQPQQPFLVYGLPPQQPFVWPFPSPVMGCVCPPGANRDCENPACPRKAPKC